jgi:hypothetical protein
MIPADSGERPDPVRIRFRWPDENQATVGRTLPLVLRAGRVDVVVAPGESADLPAGRVMAVAAVPEGAPLTAVLAPADHGLLEVPFPASDVVRAAFEDSATEEERTRVARSSLAFDVTRWSGATAPLPEDDRLRISRKSGLLRIGGRQETSAPLRLVLAGSGTPTHVIAIPRVALDESAVVHIGLDRPWGARPALTPSDDTSRLLLAYLDVGEYRLAVAMARALARAIADRNPIRWASPSFAQLLIGYAYALGRDAEALAAWCRRTQAARFLGTDGLILAAQSAWLLGRPREATDLLARAETTQPVMALGLGVAVRLAFHLAAQPDALVDFGRTEHEGERLARLVTSYSRLSSATDPLAATVTTPASQRRPVSLEGGGWRQRAAWAITYAFVRPRLAHTLKRPRGIATVLVSLQERAKQAQHHRGGTVRWTRNYFVWLLAVPAILGWLGVLAATIYYAPSHSTAWEHLLAPLWGLQAVVFTLVGAGVTLVIVGRNSRELAQRAEDSERRARAVEDQAMRGRALAATLQAEALPPGAPDSPAGHSLLSLSLFGDMIGRDVGARDAQDGGPRDSAPQDPAPQP